MDKKLTFLQTVRLVASAVAVVLLVIVGFVFAISADFFEWLAGRFDVAIDFLSRWCDENA